MSRDDSARTKLDSKTTSASHDDRMGANLAGPSLVRVPEWVAEPLGRYYLYFAHHNGGYIRLAHADHVEGPWRVHTPGSLQHSESYFPTDIGEPPANAEPGAYWVYRVRARLPGAS